MCLQRNDLLGPVHDGTIRLDRSANDIIIVFEIDDYDFGGGAFVLLFADTNERVRFECLGASTVS